MEFEIEKEFGYVILTFIGNFFVLVWMSIKVGSARKKYGVPYPQMYAEKNEKENGKMFNCVQRAHQNALEGFGIYAIMLFIAAFKYPMFATVCGNLWSTGRIVYALGYYSGEPKNRLKGEFFYFGILGLLFCNAYIALQLIGVV